MPLFRKLCIAGLGPLGSSIGLAARHHKIAEHIVGWDKSGDLMDQALDQGALDRATAFPQDELSDTDLLLSTLPPKEVPRLLRTYSRFLPQNAIVTTLLRARGAEQNAFQHALGDRLLYAGSTPLVEAHKTSKELFQGSTCLITSFEHAEHPGLRALCTFWEKLGATPKTIPPHHHDIALAAHLHAPFANTLAFQMAARELGAAFPAAQEAPGVENFPSEEEIHHIQQLLFENKEGLISFLTRQKSVVEDLITWLEQNRKNDLQNALRAPTHGTKGTPDD